MVDWDEECTTWQSTRDWQMIHASPAKYQTCYMGLMSSSFGYKL